MATRVELARQAYDLYQQLDSYREVGRFLFGEMNNSHRVAKRLVLLGELVIEGTVIS